MKLNQFISIFLLICLAACTPASPASLHASTVGMVTATPELAKATVKPTSTIIPEPTLTPTPEWTPSPDFVNQFTDTPFSLEKDQVQFTTAEEKTTIAQVKNGEIIFQANGQEVRVNSALAVVPEAKWFLHGKSDQIMAIFDTTNTYWQYEFERTSNRWVEKTLPEPSRDVNNPTPIEWNDVLGNRWATAVRAAIEAGKIPTFDPSKVKIGDMSLNGNQFYQENGWDAPDFKKVDGFYASHPEARPVLPSAFSQLNLGGRTREMVTSQLENKENSGFTLVNMVESTTGFIKQTLSNPSQWIRPVVKLENGGPAFIKKSIGEPITASWQATSGNDIMKPAVNDIINDGVWDPVWEKIIALTSVKAWH